MRRVAVALATMLMVLVSPASSSAFDTYEGTNLAQGSVYPGTVTLYVAQDGRRITYFYALVNTNCDVGSSGKSSVFARAPKNGPKVSRRGRFSTALPFMDIHPELSNSGEVVISGKLKGKRVRGHMEGSGPTCSFSADFTTKRKGQKG